MRAAGMPGAVHDCGESVYFNVGDPSRSGLAPVARRDLRAVIRHVHRMAVPADGRGVRGDGPGGAVPSSLIAHRAWGRWCSGLGTGGTSVGGGRCGGSASAGEVRGVRGDSCAAVRVHAGPAAGCGRAAGAVIGRVAAGGAGCGRRRPRRGCRIRRRGAGSAGSLARAGELAVSFAALGVELGGEVVRPRCRTPAAVSCHGDRAGSPPRPGCRAGRCWAGGGSPARDRREPAGRQRSLALAVHRQSGVSCLPGAVTRRASRHREREEPA